MDSGLLGAIDIVFLASGDWPELSLNVKVHSSVTLDYFVIDFCLMDKMPR